MKPLGKPETKNNRPVIERVWAMPNKWTFTIKPIKKILTEEMNREIWIDPFAGKHSPANVRNDLNPVMNADYNMEALEFLKMHKDASVGGVLFDPPYSPRQVMECYQGVGKETVAENTKMSFWSQCKDEIARILKPGGKVLCFGWNSMGCGMSRGFKMKRILLVPHGASKNDTIVTVETKVNGRVDAYD